ncbi:MAG TPA: GSCFA domain-containing protein [Cytophagales bacterium]|nr:GSCFA domain-containing protein [Cytophagales bacterium]
MQFRTELIPHDSPIYISHDQETVLVGSCFSENLGEKLQANKFKVHINPFGTLYDPISIFRVLNFAIKGVSNFSFVEREGSWYAYETHSEVRAATQTQLQSDLETLVNLTKQQLLSSNTLFITLGTALVYRKLDEGIVVANCHKMPARNFCQSLLEPAEILEAFSEFYQALKLFHPQIQIIFTLSPVRHIKDGIENNQVSKSLLRYCISRFTQYSDTHYFPAYEIVLDDLRDYRFYKADLIHPNDQAISYIWEKFSSLYFKAQTLGILKEWQKIRQNLAHKPFDQSSDGYRDHLRRTLSQLENLSAYLDVTKEMQYISSILN